MFYVSTRLKWFEAPTVEEAWGELRSACEEQDWARALGAINEVDWKQAQEQEQEREQMEAYAFMAAARVPGARSRRAWTMAYLAYAPWESPRLPQGSDDQYDPDEPITQRVGSLIISLSHANGWWTWHVCFEDDPKLLHGGSTLDKESARREALSHARSLGLEIFKAASKV